MAARPYGEYWTPENSSSSFPREIHNDKEDAEHSDLCARMEKIVMELRILNADTAAEYVETALRDYQHWHQLHF